jgi:hypothetical protein
MNCTKCGDILDSEEEESPQRDKDNNVICDRCYEEQYSWICPICEEKFDEDFSKEISPEYLLITEGAGEDMYLAPGIYEITSYPFFRDGMIQTSLITSAIRKILDVPKDTCKDDIYYVCENCINKIKNKERNTKEVT